jgi:hypothetical protein
MKYAVELGSGAKIYIYIYTEFLKDWFMHSKVNRGGFTDCKVIA